MKNKEIQEQRMKGYFIQATKDILKAEGIKSISVRNIADKAGYSYATLYNYFKDVNELIFVCVNDFQQECKEFVEQKTENNQPGLEKVGDIAMAYIHYFLEYPGIFELFYLTKVGDFGHKRSTIEVIGSSLDDVSGQAWKFCINENLLEEKESAFIKSQLHFTIIGMLLLYLNRQIPMNYNDFIATANSQINRILTIGN
jgi:AcrR family transcriptional regulator